MELTGGVEYSDAGPGLASHRYSLKAELPEML